MPQRRASAKRGLKVVFVGGGSFRIPPICRAAFAASPAFRGGEVRLVDLNLPRAEMVGRLIMRCPEFANADCKVSWGTSLDRALEGADALYVTMAVGSAEASIRSHQASVRRGFISSDQMSLTGAFLALTAGPAILGFARKMEKICPDALMLIFANPVGVYSGMVNNHTRIRALGLCGGFGNHRWDLSRLMGRDEYRDEYDVHVAGINHLSFILRGTHKGEDLYKVLGRYLKPGWAPPRIHHERPAMVSHIRFALRKLNEMYHRFGTIIFSTEGDGMEHLFYEEMFKRSLRHYRPVATNRIAAYSRAAVERRQQIDADYGKLVDGNISPSRWSQHGWLKAADHDLVVGIFKAMAGLGREKIVASSSNRGTVVGFKDRTVLEYSQWIDGNSVKPAGHYEIPDAFQGLMTSLATFQTLVGDAVATSDPRTLADGLFAYPVKQNTQDARMLAKELIAIHRKEIPAFCQETAAYL